MTLHSTLTARLVGLLPPERRPHPDNPMADLVGILGHVETDAVQAAFRMVYRWLASTTDEAGLELLAQSRYLRRFPGEPTEVFRERVMGAFEFWERAGTLPGVRLALEQAGYLVSITEHGVGPDREPSHWAEFSVHLRPARPLIREMRWNDGKKWGGGGKWGYRIDALPFEGVLALIREVKPAHARLRRLTFRTGRAIWGTKTRWASGREYAVFNPWGTPWGLPAVQLRRTGNVGTIYRWGEGAPQTIYEYEGAPHA